MRRARILVALVALALAFCASGVGRAAPAVNRTSGIGLLDYTRKPTFKVGDYVRYLVTGVDQDGNQQASFVITVSIAGQEIWWGERCFYLETWSGNPEAPDDVAATLMSYSIFDDSLPEEHVNMYTRKMVMGVNEDGTLDERLIVSGGAALSTRPKPSEPHSASLDTIGADTVQTRQGTLLTLKVLKHLMWAKNSGRGDSSFYRENREDRTQWLSREVPLTSYAKEETRTTDTRRAWLTGRSKDTAPAQQISTGIVTARILDFGHGLQSKALPADRVHSFDDPPAGSRPRPAPRPRTTSGGTRRR